MTKDGRYLVLAANGDSIFQRLMRALDVPMLPMMLGLSTTTVEQLHLANSMIFSVPVLCQMI